jgi:hypothetical protein
MSVIRTCVAALGFALTFAAFGGSAMAVDIGSVPELSPGSVASAVTLLSAGAFMLTAARRRSK